MGGVFARLEGALSRLCKSSFVSFGATAPASGRWRLPFTGVFDGKKAFLPGSYGDR